MSSVFKYLPEQFVSALLAGEILFRNLVYFKRLETDPRWDVFEGAHVDAPDHDVQMHNLTTGVRTRGRYSFHNTLEQPHRVFCFCTSLAFDPAWTKYGSACVEILDVGEFARRLLHQLIRRDRIVALERPLLQSKAVIYFDQAKTAPPSVDVLNPRQLPFLKRLRYGSDQEFRFVFARRGGYRLQRVVHLDRQERDNSIACKPNASITIRIGNLDKIARRVA